jgi:hypothetical protein
MKELAALLDALVADAPVDKLSWADVESRSRRARRRPRRPTRLVLALAAIALLGLVGTAVGVGISLLGQQEHFHDSAPDHPDRIGPLVEVTADDSWSLIAWRSEAGICVDFAIPGNSPFSCGFPVRGAKSPSDARGRGLPTRAVGGFVSGGGLVGGDGKMTIFGVAATEVTRVTVELRDGRVVDAPLHDAPAALEANVRFFIVRLPPLPQRLGEVGPVVAYNAYAGDELIDRAPD